METPALIRSQASCLETNHVFMAVLFLSPSLNRAALELDDSPLSPELQDRWLAENIGAVLVPAALFSWSRASSQGSAFEDEFEPAKDSADTSVQGAEAKLPEHVERFLWRVFDVSCGRICRLHFPFFGLIF